MKLKMSQKASVNDLREYHNICQPLMGTYYN